MSSCVLQCAGVCVLLPVSYCELLCPYFSSSHCLALLCTNYYKALPCTTVLRCVRLCTATVYSCVLMCATVCNRALLCYTVYECVLLCTYMYERGRRRKSHAWPSVGRSVEEIPLNLRGRVPQVDILSETPLVRSTPLLPQATAPGNNKDEALTHNGLDSVFPGIQLASLLCQGPHGYPPILGCLRHRVLPRQRPVHRGRALKAGLALVRAPLATNGGLCKATSTDTTMTKE